MSHSFSHLQVSANAGNFLVPDPTGYISKLAKFGCSPKRGLFVSVGTTIASFAILCINYVALKGPVIPGKALFGSGTLTPHTSLTIPVSGLYCDSFTINRLNWDNSEASTSWNATVYILPEKPPYYEEFDFSITNDNITLHAASRWYMRYVPLRSGSEFTINSCVREGAQNLIKVCVLRGENSYKKWLSALYMCTGSDMYAYELHDCVENNYYIRKYASFCG